MDVPDSATSETPWRLTRVSRHTYFRPLSPQRDNFAQPVRIGYEAYWAPQALEPDSDIYAFAVDRVVAVSPLSLDLTTRADAGEVESLLRGPLEL